MLPSNPVRPVPSRDMYRANEDPLDLLVETLELHSDLSTARPTDRNSNDRDHAGSRLRGKKGEARVTVRRASTLAKRPGRAPVRKPWRLTFFTSRPKSWPAT